ncbi:helix-turn-helix domain-containing protein [Streptomyces sp. NBC_01511]|uniref:helix-turn-helix transcriptional regulator n=1 Tax=Streptomyces sp. NBC_01511 TaxID=2903889 RepID=UPI00386B04C0
MPSEPAPPDWVLTQRRAIGAHIREARVAAKLSQEALAERVERDRQTVNRIENGVVATRVDTLIRIARALDMPLAELVREEPRPANGG